MTTETRRARRGQPRGAKGDDVDVGDGDGDARASTAAVTRTISMPKQSSSSSPIRVHAEVKRWNTMVASHARANASPREVCDGARALDGDTVDDEEEDDARDEDEAGDGELRGADADASTPIPMVKPAFVAFAEFGRAKSQNHTMAAAHAPVMDGTRFAKMCREAFDGDVDAAEADIIFAKRAGKTRKVDFTTFQLLLDDIVASMGTMSIEEARARVAKATPSVGAAVSPRAVRHHDDVSTYTSSARESHGVLASPPRIRDVARAHDDIDDIVYSLPRVRGLKTAFDNFCAYSGGTHSSTTLGVNRFLKLCEDCGLYRENFDAQAAGIVFNTIAGAKSKFMDFKQFQGALALAASRAGASFAHLADAVVARGEPLTNANVSPEPVRFHDDTSTYTSTRREVHLDRKLSTRALSISLSPRKAARNDVAGESDRASPPIA